jgi:hypothetical protein
MSEMSTNVLTYHHHELLNKTFSDILSVCTPEIELYDPQHSTLLPTVWCNVVNSKFHIKEPETTAASHADIRVGDVCCVSLFRMLQYYPDSCLAQTIAFRRRFPRTAEDIVCMSLWVLECSISISERKSYNSCFWFSVLCCTNLHTILQVYLTSKCENSGYVLF